MSKGQPLNRRQFIQLSTRISLGAALAAHIPIADRATASPARFASAPSGPIWPQLPAFSANNWLDHFTTVDPARWTPVTSGSGVVSVADSYVQCLRPNSGDPAFIHLAERIDKTRSQLWTICFNRQVGSEPDYFLIVDQNAPPTAGTRAEIDARTRIKASLIDDVGQPAFGVGYYDAAHSLQRWNGDAGAWTSAPAAMYQPTRNDDYYVLGFETDGANNRWRMLGWGKPSSGGYTFEQGWRLFGLSDWVSWADMESSDNLWLLLGNPYTDAPAVTWAFEWVRYAENAAPLEAWAAAKELFDNGHTIRRYYSYDGMQFVPQDRTTNVLAASSLPFEDWELQEPWAVNDGAVDYLFYTGKNQQLNGSICVASAPHTQPQLGPWTRSLNNPILTPLEDEFSYGFACVINDTGESDPERRWKMLYSASSRTDGKWRMYYATAADPPDTSPWTRRGLALDVGAPGAPDSTAARDGVVIWYNSQWEVWYEGQDDTGFCHLMRATGSDLGALSKDGAGSRLAAQPAGRSPLTADLNGRIVTVESTAGFVRDAIVVFDQDPNLDDYGASRIRKVLSSTQVELYHALDGFTTATPAVMKQADAGKYFTPRSIVRVGNEWWFYFTLWETFLEFSDGPNYRALIEENVLYTHADPSPSGAPPVPNYLASPVIPRGFNVNLRSLENMTLLLMPLVRRQIFIPLVIAPSD